MYQVTCLRMQVGQMFGHGGQGNTGEPAGGRKSETAGKQLEMVCRSVVHRTMTDTLAAPVASTMVNWQGLHVSRGTPPGVDPSQRGVFPQGVHGTEVAPYAPIQPRAYWHACSSPTSGLCLAYQGRVSLNSQQVMSAISLCLLQTQMD